jgi:predicted secreted protein
MRRQVLFLMLLIILSVTAFAQVKKDAPITIVTDLGNLIVITMESNATTGYHWELARPIDKKTIELLGSKYIRPKKSLRLGAEGSETWTFRPKKSGDNKISFKYVRPWEVGVPPIKTKEFLVKIGDVKVKEAAEKPEETISPEQAQQIIEEKAKEIIQVLANRDIEELAKYVHPRKGIRFSPYGNINLKTDKVLQCEELGTIYESQENLTWGEYDGSGLPIYKSFADYFEEFVYDRNFQSAQQVGFNRIIGKGNIKNNIKEIYPRAIFVEYYIKESAGPGWESLRLVFEKLEDQWYLIGIIHDAWTI